MTIEITYRGRPVRWLPGEARNYQKPLIEDYRAASAFKILILGLGYAHAPAEYCTQRQKTRAEQ